MAEEKQEEIKEVIEKPPPPDNLGSGVMTPDLGPVADALSDEMPEDERSEEEKEAADNAARNPIPEDPTKGMSPAEEKQYWLKRANHFEKEYQVERAKRQTYDKKYGGLNNSITRTTEAPSSFTEFDGKNGTVPKSLDEVGDLASYTRYVIQEAGKHFRKQMTEEQMDERVSTTEAHAREIHTGEDGLPSYDELIDEYVVPMVRKNPRIFDLIRHMPDPAEASYTLGFLLKYPNFKEMVESQTRDATVKNINKTAKQAANVQGRSSGHQASGKLTKAEIDAMSPEEFEKELEKFRGSA